MDPFKRFSIQRKTQLLTKSDQWYDDARFLHRAGRYEAFLYLGSFAIECLLKAALWHRRHEERIRGLLFAHELDGLMAANPELSLAWDREGGEVHQRFVQICTWNVRIRYNPRKVDRGTADRFMTCLCEVRQWLGDRI
jgi:hypothetical protein